MRTPSLYVYTDWTLPNPEQVTICVTTPQADNYESYIEWNKHTAKQPKAMISISIPREMAKDLAEQLLAAAEQLDKEDKEYAKMVEKEQGGK